MGLTVSNTNLSLDRLMGQASSQVHKFGQQKASGLQINQAKDKPAGLVISEMLRAQISGLSQGVENTERASAVVSVAEGGLSNISSQLTQARTLAVEAANSGGMDSSQVSALQGEMNAILGGIDFQANTTSFSGKSLLDGSQEVQTENVDPAIEHMDITSARDGAVVVEVSAEATTAQASGAIAATQATDETIVIQGSEGTAEIQLSAGQTQAEVEDAINAVSEQTGVQSSGGAISSVGYGSDATVSITGAITGVDQGFSAGTDIEGTINGATAEGSGATLSASGSGFTGSVTVAQGSGTGAYSADVTGGGMKFQLGGTTGDSVRIGISSAHTSSVGETSGKGSLSSLFSGGAASLAEDPLAAIDIIDSAISEISSQRASLGAFQSNVLESNVSSLRTDMVNTTDSESRIRDTDFAKAIMQHIQSQVREQSSLAMGVQANTSAKNVMTLLGA